MLVVFVFGFVIKLKYIIVQVVGLVSFEIVLI